jgi:hypothetical protein
MNHMPARVRRNYGPPSQRSEGAQILGRGLARLSISNNLVRDSLSLVKSRQPRAFDRANVHEDVLAAVIRLDESEALLAIEPLHSSLRHVSFFSTCALRPRSSAASSFEIWRKVVNPTQLCREAKSFGRSSIDVVWSIGAMDARLASAWLDRFSDRVASAALRTFLCGHCGGHKRLAAVYCERGFLPQDRFGRKYKTAPEDGSGDAGCLGSVKDRLAVVEVPGLDPVVIFAARDGPPRQRHPGAGQVPASGMPG